MGGDGGRAFQAEGIVFIYGLQCGGSLVHLSGRTKAGMAWSGVSEGRAAGRG